MSSALTMLLVVWAGLTAILVVLLIYRSTLTMQEDEQLFLDEAEAHMREEQAELHKKVDKVTPAVRFLGAASGLLIVVIAGLWVYQGLSRVQ